MVYVRYLKKHLKSMKDLYMRAFMHACMHTWRRACFAKKWMDGINTTNRSCITFSNITKFL